jgi:LAS superfamily LD-carboxypeptidase LdcB
MNASSRRPLIALGTLALLAAGLAAWGGYSYRGATRELDAVRGALSAESERARGLDAALAALRDEKADIEEDLRTERNKNESFQRQIDKIAGTVGTLEKLSKTDEELLQKYSKVYFLNEHYVPSQLTDVPSRYVLGGKVQSFHRDALPFLESLLEAAEEDGVELRVISAYRSFTTQAQLKSGYRVTYGSGANQFSADQGYSEHQLGTTVDFTTPDLGSNFTGFDKTEAYEWLRERAHRYGFVLSYPQGNAYYQFEPWHWRFVGTDLARDLNRRGESFYDLDQREIDEYLVGIFD